MATARVGCSGWQYKHWKGDFYPARLPQTRWLEYYAARFDTVEINNSFYRLPSEQAFASWRDRAPGRFCYAVKASRFLTHMKKLKDPAAPLELFFSHAQHLRPALGPVLYQLPPHWPLNLERLREFVAMLPRGQRHAIEFREPSWYDRKVFEALQAHDVGLCLHDMAGSESPRLRTAPFVYVRFHGPSRYAGTYPDAALRPWAEWLAAQQREGADVYAYFNNDIGGHAPRDAVRLRTMLAAS
jgi:uncharacterized protein YecE (DUF72 family)